MFRQWTGLELAVFHQWGGPSSTERAEALMEEVLGMFQGVDKIYKDVRIYGMFASYS
jgi:Pre-rRNA-processing protein TSR2